MIGERLLRPGIGHLEHLREFLVIILILLGEALILRHNEIPIEYTKGIL